VGPPDTLNMTKSNCYQEIFSVVSRIPKGRVATYGQVALLAGLPRKVRLVGYALSAVRNYLPIPWHRVVNAKGQISSRFEESPAEELQRLRLEDEGVIFDARDCIPLIHYQWHPEQKQR